MRFLLLLSPNAKCRSMALKVAENQNGQNGPNDPTGPNDPKRAKTAFINAAIKA